MLERYRVIDFCTDRSLLCGQILADLGADVICVEPPGGASARQRGPYADGVRDPERSLEWWAYARGKRSIALDLNDAADRAQARRLVAGADFVIESEPPGVMAGRGLDYAALAAESPGLVYVSITPFGQDGPRAAWQATDLTLAAAAGTAYLSGDAHRPPVRISVPQADLHAAADAALGALLAHVERRRSGRGQHVDVSAQQSLTLATMFRSLDAPLEEAPARRLSGGVLLSGKFLPHRFRLADGWVILAPAILPSTGHFMERLLGWIADTGQEHERERVAALRGEAWGSFAIRMLLGQLPGDAYEPVAELLRSFFARQTKAEVMRQATERRLLLAPVLGLDEIIDSEQLAARGFLVELPHRPSGRQLRYPGAFARFGASPIRFRRGPPGLDEHGDEIRAEAPRRPAATTAAAESRRLPLEGVRILDFFWVLAGPTATRVLADYGADVVHVESQKHLDTLRVIPPYQFSNPHPEGAGGAQSANVNKRALTLDLEHPAAREVALELARWADVVTESFAPGVMERAGLGWKDLQQVNPRLIMISSCLLGQTGPWHRFAGFGNLAAAVTGFQSLAGWPDEPPSGPWGAYTDFIASRYNALAILAALEHRDRTGEGQYIDMAQAESALHFLGPAFLDYTANGRVPSPCGNDDPEMFPHGVYPTAGKDRWIALGCRDALDWERLCAAMGRPDMASRRAERDEVTRAIEEWARPHEAGALAELLQAHGVPAYAVLDTPGLYEDPQLQHREHFLEIAHQIYQTSWVESTRLRLSRTPARKPERAIHLGADNRSVLEEILGYTPERIWQLAQAGVLT